MKSLIILSILTVLLIKVDCRESYKERKKLTERENEIRFSSCGDPKTSYWMVYIMEREVLKEYRKLRKQITQKEEEEYEDWNAELPDTPDTTVIPTSPDPGNNVTTTLSPTEVLKELREKAKDLDFSTGVLLSYNHVLTSSSFFIEKRGSKWFDKQNNEIIANCTKRTHFRMANGSYRVTDGTRFKRYSDSIIFLNFCSLQHTAKDFLTVVLLDKQEDAPPRQVICLPKKHIVPKNGLNVRFSSFSSDETIETPGNAITTAGLRATSIRDCEMKNSSGLICTSGVSCTRHKGAPLIKKAATEYEVDMLLGIVVTESCNPNSIEVFHDVKAAMPTLCKHFNICNRKVTKVPLDREKENRGKVLTVEDDYVYQEPEPTIADLLKGSRRSLGLISLVIVMMMKI